jgi:hypothetical protein
MARVADIPIIGGILQSFFMYFSRSAKILRNPFGFARSIDFEDRVELKDDSYTAHSAQSPGVPQAVTNHLGLPLIMVMGPKFAFGRIGRSVLPPAVLSLMYGPNIIWLMNVTSILLLVIGLTILVLSIVWISRIYEIPIFRVTFAFAIALWISLPIIQYVYYPLLGHVEGWLVNNVFRFL